MTNYQKMLYELTGDKQLPDMMPEVPPDCVSHRALMWVACPFEKEEDPEKLPEIEGCPSRIQCAACKRAWLAREAEG